MRENRSSLTRNLPLVPACSALLIIDVQNYCCRRDGGMFRNLTPARIEREYGDFFRSLDERVIPNLRRLVAACRETGIEVMFTTIEALTLDGRDQSLDYAISGILVPRGSRDAQVIDDIRPAADEIRLPKTASSVFNATNIEFVLRNLGVERLAIAGILTDQCVESAVRDACDRGFLVTLVTDACTSLDDARHENSLAAMRGYCRQTNTEALVTEITDVTEREDGRP